MSTLQIEQASDGFPARLQTARKRAGYPSQAAFARAVGCDQMTIHRHEIGSKRPSRRSVERYAEVLGVTPAYLLWGAGDATPHVVPGAVRAYLSHHDVSDATRSRLMRLPWSLLVDGEIRESHVAEVRALVDRNLRNRAGLPDASAQLPLSRSPLPVGRDGTQHFDPHRADAPDA